MTLAFNQSESKRLRRHLRANMPPAEVLLWSKLKSRQLLGCKFRRQFGIESYTVDFYSPEIKLAIELDGDSHFRPGGQDFDRRRDATIRSFGIHVLRFLNTDVYDNLDGLWEVIVREARKRMRAVARSEAPGRRVQRARRAE